MFIIQVNNLQIEEIFLSTNNIIKKCYFNQRLEDHRQPWTRQITPSLNLDYLCSFSILYKMDLLVWKIFLTGK